MVLLLLWNVDWVKKNYSSLPRTRRLHHRLDLLSQPIASNVAEFAKTQHRRLSFCKLSYKMRAGKQQIHD